jgi:hypothetical protein
MLLRRYALVCTYFTLNDAEFLDELGLPPNERFGDKRVTGQGAGRCFLERRHAEAHGGGGTGVRCRPAVESFARRQKGSRSGDGGG